MVRTSLDVLQVEVVLPELGRVAQGGHEGPAGHPRRRSPACPVGQVDALSLAVPRNGRWRPLVVRARPGPRVVDERLVKGQQDGAVDGARVGAEMVRFFEVGVAVGEHGDRRVVDELGERLARGERGQSLLAEVQGSKGTHDVLQVRMVVEPRA